MVGWDSGLLSALLLAFLTRHIVSSSVIMRESLATLALILTFVFLMRALKKAGRSHDVVLLGVFLALSSLSRYTLLPITLTLFAASLWVLRKKRGLMIPLSAVFLLILAPWGFYTWSYFGQPFYTNTFYQRYSDDWQPVGFSEILLRCA